MEVPGELIRIAKIVGENEDGLTLFVPKDMEGVFHLEGGDRFLTLMFAKKGDEGGLTLWLPWKDNGEE